MSDRYYLIRTTTLREIVNAISHSVIGAEFPNLRIIGGTEIHRINHQTLVDIANVIREKNGTTNAIPVSDLAAKILELNLHEDLASGHNSAILGQAVLGRMILGNSVSLPRLDTPEIYVETIEEDIPKLDTPVISLFNDTLDAPVIRIEEITYKLDVPFIYMGCEHAPSAYTAEETRSPTCDGDGEMTYTCTVCGHQRTETIPALGHAYNAIEDDNQPSGYIGVCSECGDVIEDYTP